jgi:dTDP-4-amino-4,6-dideoxygalactose transaminase
MSHAPARTLPLVDLSHVNGVVEQDVLADIAEIVAAGAFTNGPHVGRFEEAFAAHAGAAECVGVSSGLDALRLALIAAGVGPGDQVIVPALTFVATFEAVSQAGATPVVADVGEADYQLDPDAAAAAVGPLTRCILPAHLYGQMADMRGLAEVARRAGAGMVEDACQAHGAVRDGARPGARSAAAAYSFYPTKNLGAMGDAGALVTDDPGLASRARALRQHGEREDRRSGRIGYTARLDTLQAAVLLRKLPHLDGWNRERAAAADLYAEGLAGAGDVRPLPVPDGSRPVWHLYPVRTAHSEGLRAHLAGRGIATGRHYAEPPHLSAAYASLGLGPGAFPVAESLCSELVSLPLYPGIGEEQVSGVCDAIREFFDHGV